MLRVKSTAFLNDEYNNYVIFISYHLNLARLDTHFIIIIYRGTHFIKNNI